MKEKITAIKLDVGSGSSAVCFCRKPEKGTLHLLFDNDIDELKEAKKYVSNYAKKHDSNFFEDANIKYTHGTATHLPFKDNSIDHIDARAFIHWGIGPEELMPFLIEATRILKLNGTLTISTRNKILTLIKAALEHSFGFKFIKEEDTTTFWESFEKAGAGTPDYSYGPYKDDPGLKFWVWTFKKIKQVNIKELLDKIKDQ